MIIPLVRASHSSLITGASGNYLYIKTLSIVIAI
jgi:hypothetical protein